MEELTAAIEHPKSVRRLPTREGKQQRMGCMGRNKVTVIYEEETKVIITVYNYNKDYYSAKNKHRRNKNRRNLKKELGNRIK